MQTHKGSSGHEVGPASRPGLGASLIQPGERIDDLQYAGFQLIQNPMLYCFSTDAVLLADFARVPRGASVVDLGAGNGILEVLLYSRQEDANYRAVEIAPELYDLLVRNAALNGMEDRVQMELGDLRDAKKLFGAANDVCVCNPPYETSGEPRQKKTQEAARKETHISFPEICRAAASCLRFGGRFYLVHRSYRLAEILSDLKMNGLEPKLLRLCAGAAGKEPKTCLVMAQKGAHEGMRILSQLTMREADGEETPELRRIYRREEIEP